MSSKESQAILKRFIDLKFSVWFTLGSEKETMFCDTWNFFDVDSWSLNDGQSYILNKFQKSKKSS